MRAPTGLPRFGTSVAPVQEQEEEFKFAPQESHPPVRPDAAVAVKIHDDGLQNVGQSRPAHLHQFDQVLEKDFKPWLHISQG